MRRVPVIVFAATFGCQGFRRFRVRQRGSRRPMTARSAVTRGANAPRDDSFGYEHSTEEWVDT